MKHTQLKTHGGKRPNSGAPKKLQDPVTTSVTFEKTTLEQFKSVYGNEWQDVIRKLARKHLTKNGLERLNDLS